MDLVGKFWCAVIGTALIVLLTRNSDKQSPARRHHPRINTVPDDRPLEFVHISMTGGRAIETAGFQGAGLLWGSCHFAQQDDIGCRFPDWHVDFIGHEDDPSKKFDGEPENAPPHWMRPNPYEGKDLFTVVRNPYDRIIGEYNLYGGPFNKEGNELKMNKWIQAHLQYIKDYEYFPGQFLPQHFYVFDDSGHQTIPNVLRYENLREEFKALMKRKGLQDVYLPPKDTSRNIFTKTQLSERNIRMINAIYAEDFRLFYYPMAKKPSDFATSMRTSRRSL